MTSRESGPASSNRASDAILAEDQSRTIAFLGEAGNLGASGEVARIETHISEIFLAGDRAFKLKRAVRLPYLDFSTAHLRLETCEREVTFNSRTAPDLYLGVRRITEEADGLALDGEGRLVDAVVEMRRFDQALLLDRMAEAGELTPRLMHDVARMIARFHRGARVVQGAGGAANLAGVLDINEAGFATSHVFPPEAVERLNGGFRDALATHAGRLDRREARGCVRLCHGDLHLRNICLFDGVPTLFDCIEFNDAIATVDVLYDLAFLLMDLWHRGLHGLANLVANRYLDGADEDDGIVLLPFFMAVRAAVRAHVTATQIEEGSAHADALARKARSYFDLAGDLLVPRTARLVAIGGLSGSGKTTVAEALAPRIGAPPGARIGESDRLRKAMFKVPPDMRLTQDAYRREVSDDVYDRLAQLARTVAGDGGTVVVDAVFDKPDRRAAIEQAAAAAGVPFTGIWLAADPATLRKRVAARSGGPSDATVEVLDRQLAGDAGDIAWHRIAASRPPREIVQSILDAVDRP